MPGSGLEAEIFQLQCVSNVTTSEWRPAFKIISDKTSSARSASF